MRTSRARCSGLHIHRAFPPAQVRILLTEQRYGSSLLCVNSLTCTPEQDALTPTCSLMTCTCTPLPHPGRRSGQRPHYKLLPQGWGPVSHWSSRPTMLQQKYSGETANRKPITAMGGATPSFLHRYRDILPNRSSFAQVEAAFESRF